jgi:hypothetical protein
MLPQIRHDLDVVVLPEPSWSSGAVPDWCGVPCRVGRVEMWLPVLGSDLKRCFSVLVLLPRQNVPHALPFVYLGVQFYLEYRADLTFSCSSSSPHTSTGQLVIP